ncbi:MAG: hypothetical protein M5U31_15240 [Acidimicrobiia bacterium]|nr:hypothetical protein [Acidimicrobiia bacterium]
MSARHDGNRMYHPAGVARAQGLAASDVPAPATWAISLFFTHAHKPDGLRRLQDST